MEFIIEKITDFTEIVRALLASLNIQPESYIFLFPAGKDVETIRQLVTDGVFPTIPYLAPAITYAVIFSLVRFTMQHAILKVIT